MKIHKHKGAGQVSEVIDINENKPHINVKALCLEIGFSNNFMQPGYVPCFKQWIGTCPEGTNLTKLECPKCGAQNSFAVEIK